MGSTLQLRLPVPVTAEQVRRLCGVLREQLRTGGVTAVVCHAERAAGDLATVDAVARLALVARRAGVAFSLDGQGADLTALLDLLGLQAALAVAPDDP